MDRSLTITPEESATTSSLLTGFLLLAVVWLAISGLGLGDSDAAPTDLETPVSPQ